jgi:Holliday junction resolvase-like predicted endonuclease
MIKLASIGVVARTEVLTTISFSLKVKLREYDSCPFPLNTIREERMRFLRILATLLLLANKRKVILKRSDVIIVKYFGVTFIK